MAGVRATARLVSVIVITMRARSLISTIATPSKTDPTPNRISYAIY